MGGNPIESKCGQNDIVYLHIIDYRVVAQGKVLEKKITVLNSLSQVFAVINSDAEYKKLSCQNHTVLDKLSRRLDGTYKLCSRGAVGY